MYAADFNGFRGVNVIDMATGAVSNVELNPGDHATTEEVSGVVVKDGCVWAAYSGIQQAYDPDFRNRLYCIDRQTRTITGHTDVVTSTEMATMWLVAHPDPAIHRLYAFNVTISGWNAGVDCALNLCQEIYLPGTPGTVTEVDSQTGAVLRTFVVGSQPLKGVVDRARNRLYVINVGDESLSVVDLGTGTVGTVPLPEFGYKRQPADVALMDGKIWVSDYRDSVWVYDSSMALAGSVTLDSLSGPGSMTVLDGKLYVSLQSGYSMAVAEVNADLSVNRQFAVSAHPGAITSYVSGQ
jgi:DNA-binding beta-propeller fold protein YncE